MQKGKSAEIAKRDARRMYDENARDSGKECAEILDENVRDVGQESREMLNGTALGIVMPDSVPGLVAIKNVSGNVKRTVRGMLIESASKVRWKLRRTLQRLPSSTTSF